MPDPYASLDEDVKEAIEEQATAGVETQVRSKESLLAEAYSNKFAAQVKNEEADATKDEEHADALRAEADQHLENEAICLKAAGTAPSEPVE